MKQTVPPGRVAGIRVGAHWSVLVLVVVFGWLLGAQVLPAMTPHQPAPAGARPARLPAAGAARRSRRVASVTGQGAARPWLGRLRRPDHEPGTGG